MASCAFTTALHARCPHPPLSANVKPFQRIISVTARALAVSPGLVTGQLVTLRDAFGGGRSPKRADCLGERELTRRTEVGRVGSPGGGSGARTRAWPTDEVSGFSLLAAESPTSCVCDCDSLLILLFG